MKAYSYYEFFKNLSNRTRFKIIIALRDQSLNVSAIASFIGEEQSKVSHNLKKMSACHILNIERRGKERIYSLNRDTIIPILNIVERHVKKNCSRGCNKQKVVL